VTGTDDETRAAVAALVFRLRNKGDADDEVFAAEFIAALKARGWRPVLAVSADADWRRASGRQQAGSLDPDVKAALFAQMAEASQAIRNGTKATGGQPALTEENDRQESR
jgi:hypothetical protein